MDIHFMTKHLKDFKTKLVKLKRNQLHLDTQPYKQRHDDYDEDSAEHIVVINKPSYAKNHTKPHPDTVLNNDMDKVAKEYEH